jgi:molecular chaperone DnaJ
MEEVKKAYKRAAFEYHPDRNPGGDKEEESFKRLTEAYEQITTSPSPPGGGGVVSDFEGWFNDLFGRRRGGRETPSGGAPVPDIHRTMCISLRESYTGTQEFLEYTREMACGTCPGSRGWMDIPCAGCDGRGLHRGEPLPGLVVNVTCEPCRGSGGPRSIPCGTCHMRGAVPTGTSLRVSVPPGIRDGDTLVAKGQGSYAPGGMGHGNLVIRIVVEQPPPEWTRDSHGNLTLVLEINLYDSLLGGVYPVTHPGSCEQIPVIIPPDTEPGSFLKPMTGLGFPRVVSGGRGDMHVQVKVRMPRSKDLGPESRAVLKSISNK